MGKLEAVLLLLKLEEKKKRKEVGRNEH